MFRSRKIAALAGVLGSVALVGLGAVQAVGIENPGTCTEDSKGHVRCVRLDEYRVTGGDEKVRVDNETSQSCSGAGELACASSLAVGGTTS